MNPPRSPRGVTPSAPAGAARTPVLDLPKGISARLCPARNNGQPPAWLVSLGFVPGTQIRIIRGAPLGGPVEIDIRGTRVCVRRSDLHGFEAIIEDGP